MIRNTLLALTLGSLIASSGVFGDTAQNDSEAEICCLAEEWQLEDTVAELQQSASSACRPKADSIACCLAEEWVPAEEPVVADVPGPESSGYAKTGEFCCIADEWSVR